MIKSLLILSLIGTSFSWDPLWDDGHYGIVHLFEWGWNDIAEECENFLGPKKFGGVQISPPTENHISYPDRPWWERYQPISYSFTTRSGNRADLENMIQRCNNVGVRIYADLVINHMSGAGTQGTGTGGTEYDANTLNFPGVPYSSWDFNPSCDNGINYNDPNSVRNCWLVGLTDLNQSKDYVRGKIVDLMNDMLGMGMAGFRVDAAKHMWPGDLEAIYNGVNNVNVPGKLNRRPFIYQEVIDQGGEAVQSTEYTPYGSVTEFKYCGGVASNVQDNKLQYLTTVGESWGYLPSNDAFIFVNNHDNQRGHGGAGSVITFEDPVELKILSAYMMAYNYGTPRIMSSYYFSNTDEGPPGSSPPPYSTSARKYDCGGENEHDWVCEHRWFPIRNMAEFGAVANGQSMSPTTLSPDSFCIERGNKAVLCLNNDYSDQSVFLSVGLSDGCYCNVYNSDKEDCYDQVTISNGRLNTSIAPKNGIAIHENAKCPVFGGSDSCSDCSCNVNTRVDCGYTGISQSQCESQGCNWCPTAASGVPYCFYK